MDSERAYFMLGYSRVHPWKEGMSPSRRSAFMAGYTRQQTWEGYQDSKHMCIQMVEAQC